MAEESKFQTLWRKAQELLIPGRAVDDQQTRTWFKEAVYDYVEAVIEDLVNAGDLARVTNAEEYRLGNKRFLELNAEERRIHVAKAAGYSGSDNPDTWANFREADNWGVTPFLGCMVRLGDKYRRVQNLVRNPDNDRVGEPVVATLMDLSNYAKIGVCLWEEEHGTVTESEVVGGFFERPPTPYDELAGQKAYLEQLGQAERVAVVLHTLYGGQIKKPDTSWTADAVRILKVVDL